MNSLESYIAAGGYAAARRVVERCEPGEIIALVAASGLRDRFGGREACGPSWARIRQSALRDTRADVASGARPLLAAHAGTSEPGFFLDRWMLEQNPHRAIEGMIIAAWAIGAQAGCFYVRRELERAARSVERAVEEASGRGFLGEGVFGSRWSFEISVHRGWPLSPFAGTHALVAAIEGALRQIPSEHSRTPELFGRPVAVHGIEVLGLLPSLFARDSLDPAGAANWPRLVPVAISGHVERPGVYEVPPGTLLADVIEGPAGGVWKHRALKAVFPGGIFGPVLSPREIRVPALPEWSVPRVRASSPAAIVLDETTDMARVLCWVARCYERALRRHCGACRDGSEGVARIAARILSGQGSDRDLEKIAKIARALRDGALCPQARGGASAIEDLIEKFGAEIERSAFGRGPAAPRESPAIVGKLAPEAQPEEGYHAS